MAFTTRRSPGGRGRLASQCRDPSAPRSQNRRARACGCGGAGSPAQVCTPGRAWPRRAPAPPGGRARSRGPTASWHGSPGSERLPQLCPGPRTRAHTCCVCASGLQPSRGGFTGRQGPTGPNELLQRDRRQAGWSRSLQGAPRRVLTGRRGVPTGGPPHRLLPCRTQVRSRAPGRCQDGPAGLREAGPPGLCPEGWPTSCLIPGGLTMGSQRTGRPLLGGPGLPLSRSVSRAPWLQPGARSV